MIYSLLLSFILILPAYSFDKDFTLVNDRAPLEFSHLFESMKLEVKTPSEKLRLVGLCKDINTNLGFLQKEHIYLLMKSEVIKDTLEYKFSKTRQLDITTLLSSRLEEGFLKKSKFLNPFSLWIWRSIIAELKVWQKVGIITERSFSLGNFDGKKKDDALRFEKYLHYLNPWIDRMDSLEASDFNRLTMDVGWTVLRRINERSILFKRFAASANGNTQITLFNIPQKLLSLSPQQIKNFDQETPLSYREKSELEKTEATKTINKVSPEDLSTVSDDLARELDKKTQP